MPTIRPGRVVFEDQSGRAGLPAAVMPSVSGLCEAVDPRRRPARAGRDARGAAPRAPRDIWRSKKGQGFQFAAHCGKFCPAGVARHHACRCCMVRYGDIAGS